MNRSQLAAEFRQLHRTPPLVLPNAWDASSARVIELAGAKAIATTSAGVSWAHGCGDGQRLTRAEMLEAIRRIVTSVRVPVTADIEGGYDDITETVRGVIQAGAVGINLEDSSGNSGSPLLEAEAQAERIRTARNTALEAGIDLFINARTDVYLFQAGAPETRLEETVRRAQLYRAAGADGVFVPGVTNPQTIAALARAIHAPFNIMATTTAPSIPELVALGVTRVSVGAAIAKVALEATRRAARELLEQGTYQTFETALPSLEANRLFDRD
jgi:2-methylisocitrate lyase-like PEP mutase family enzyme